MAKAAETVEVAGHKISLTNLEKVLYPGARFTKAQVIDYYIRVADYLLPHLKDRPVTLKRFPDGVRGEFFYEKNAPTYTPEWIERFPVPSRTRGSDIHYILINDLATLVWLANAANLEIHPFLHRVPDIQKPTSIVFDLDPGEGSDVLTCGRVALLVRDVLSELKLESFVKVSGSKGIQMYVPLNTAASYAITTPFAESIAELMERRHPDLIVSRMAKQLRSSKVFIDWSQNNEHKTTVSVYSLRAKSDRPYVSVPVSWSELESALRSKDPRKLYFEAEQALNRFKKLGDLFEPVLRLKQQLPEEFSKLAAARVPERGNNSTEAYRLKRDFAKTPEPAPTAPERSRQASRRRFVIQKHDASHLHYDFRLEMHGALKSWAVPKGPPYAAGTKRLAMATEDHPLAYLDFEGIIPKGQYGGGTVMVWDIGTYELIERNYYKGKLRIQLNGRKLKGEWTLARARDEGEKKWYLIKTGASIHELSQKQEDSSALTGHTLAEIAKSPSAEWQSNRAAANKSEKTVERESVAAGAATMPDLSSLPAAKMEFVAPMLAKPVQQLPQGAGWSYELKLDGYRALVVKANGNIAVLSRRRNRLNRKFPSIADAFEGLADGTILDGEIVALDEHGKPSFNALQNWKSTDQPLYFYAFDVLAYESKDFRRLPLSQRRQVLEHLALNGLKDPVRLSPIFETPAANLVEAVREQGLEGIVAKRVESIYQSGERSGAWLKMRVGGGQEFVIGGYTPSPTNFDALVVGYYEDKKLMYAGRVRNGFVPSVREQVFKRFKGLQIKTCPFANLPEKRKGRWGEGMTEADMQKCIWLKPQLVAAIDYAEITPAKHLRHSKFVALREDKRAQEVTLEKPGA